MVEERKFTSDSLSSSDSIRTQNHRNQKPTTSGSEGSSPRQRSSLLGSGSGLPWFRLHFTNGHSQELNLQLLCCQRASPQRGLKCVTVLDVLPESGSRAGSRRRGRPSLGPWGGPTGRPASEGCSETPPPFRRTEQSAGPPRELLLTWSGLPDSLGEPLGHGPHQHAAPVVAHQGDLRNGLDHRRVGVR